MSEKTIHIIGGGIIGLSAAWYLQEQGFEVTIIDKTDLSDGTSHGNAGMIVPSHFVPLAAPGVISKGIRWMFNAKSPFYIRPRLDIALMKWLWHFYRSCNAKNVQQAAPVLLAFNQWSRSLYEQFAEEIGLDFSFEKKGLLMLFKTAKQQKEEESLIKKANALGLSANLLSKTAVEQLENRTDLDILGGAYFPDDAHLSPNQFMEQLMALLQKKGVQFVQGEVIDFTLHQQKVKQIHLTNHQQIEVNQVLCTAGSWSVSLLKKAGIPILLQDGKGYSFTIPKPEDSPRIPSILAEVKVAVTPMGNQLRIGGTLELSGLSPNIHKARLEGILESIPKFYPNLHIENIQQEKPWLGYRPCTPDGMPYIGQTSKLQNLFIATGHGMMGMSLGPATGKLISQIICQQKTSIATSLFKIDRF